VKRLLLVDGHSVAYRSHFAFIRDPLRNSKGQNTSAAYGFANMLRKLFRDLGPTHCAVVFDAPGRTFRHEQYEDYKAQRPPTPDELAQQLPLIKELVAAWGIVSFEVAGVEADDVIGTLARQMAGPGCEVVIATSDKDMLQLVDGTTVTYDPWKRTRFGPEEVRQKLGVGPEQVVDYMALTGDSVDNVPGVPGIGPKRARAVLERHGSLDAALEQVENVRRNRDLALLSRELVRIRTDVELATDFEQLEVHGPDKERLRAILERLEFHGMLKDMCGAEARQVVEGEFDPAGLAAARAIALAHDEEHGWWVSGGDGRAMPVPDPVQEHLGSLLEDSRVVKVAGSLKRLLPGLRASGGHVRPPLFDVGVAAWLVNPNRRSYALADVAAQVLGRSTEQLSPAQETVLATELRQVLDPQLDELGVRAVFEELEMPLLPILADMEARGVRIDVEHFGRLDRELSGEIRETEQAIWKQAGIEFNVGSPKQLAEVLFERLGLPKGKKTKTGYSTGSAVLTRLRDAHPVVPLALRHRELSKLCGTYVRPMLRSVNAGTGRIHAHFNQTGAATGRLSSSGPNLQSIPIRTDLGRRIRRGFVAAPGNVLISADYSQVELRVLAQVSEDSALREAFARGDDIHIQTAATIFDTSPADVSDEQRRMAKVVNYGLIYGMGDFGLSSRMGISLDRARAFLDDYMVNFAGVAEWRDRIVKEAEESGRVRTIAGRVRPVPGIASRNRNVAEAARRAAINAPIQGSAADIMKRAMVRLDKRLREGKITLGMVIQVHDELLLDVSADRAGEVRDIVREEMEQAWELSVPLVVDIGIGANWAEAH
jgi:DNA polymerase-1